MSLKLLIDKHGNTVSNRIISFSLLIASLFTIMKAGVIYDFSKNDNLDGWIYGCDICQEVCPWNISFSQASDDSYFKPRESIADRTDQDWNNLDQSDFSQIFKKSAVKRAKFSGLKRNIEKNKFSKE